MSAIATFSPLRSVSKTPASPSPASVPPPSPGTWRHPRFTEIISRQSVTTFSDRNFRRALLNTVALILSLVFSPQLHSAITRSSTALTIPSPAVVGSYSLLAIRTCAFLNIASALLPLFPVLLPNDQVTDIPLTPTQRKLLGLDPGIPSAPPTPESGGYVTPPRYRRSSGSFSGSNGGVGFGTPLTDRRSISATYSTSPLSASRRAGGLNANPHGSSSRGYGNGAPFSPSASPLLQKTAAVNRRDSKTEGDENRRKGYGSSGLRRSQSLKEEGQGAKAGYRDQKSPSTGLGGARSPGMNYKWLYERGAQLPRSESIQF